MDFNPLSPSFHDKCSLSTVPHHRTVWHNLMSRWSRAHHPLSELINTEPCLVLHRLSAISQYGFKYLFITVRRPLEERRGVRSFISGIEFIYMHISLLVSSLICGFDHVRDMAFYAEDEKPGCSYPMIIRVSSFLIVRLQVCLWFLNISAARICTDRVEFPQQLIMNTVWFLAVWTLLHYTTVPDLASPSHPR